MLNSLILSFLGRTCTARPGDAGQELRWAANENVPILGPGKDPAAALARVRVILAGKRQENARQGTLLASAEKRRAYEEGLALERALLWKYFGRH